MRFRWFFIALISLFILSMTVYPLESDDLYMYLAIARRFFAEGQFPALDPFLYSLKEYPWVIMHQWFGYLIFYGIYKIGGFDLIILFKAMLYILIFTIPLLFMKIKDKLSLTVWALSVVISLYASSFRLMERTSLFSDLFLVMTLSIVLAEFHKPCRLKLFLPLIFLLWVNIHPAFVFGWAVCAWYLLVNIKNFKHEHIRSFFMVFIGSILISLLNPQFIDGVLYPFKFAAHEVAVYRQYYFEWKSTLDPLFLKATHTYFIFIVIAINIFLLILGRRAKGILFCAGLSLFFIYYGLSTIRFVPTMCFALTVMNIYLASCLQIKFADTRKFSVLQGSILSGILFTTLYNLIFGYNTISGPRTFSLGQSPNIMPDKAVEFVNQIYKNDGKIFNTHLIGSYLAWTWDGDKKLFYHGFVTDTDFYLKEYIPFFNAATFDQQIQKYDIKYIIVDYYSVDRAYLDMVSENPQWQLGFSDNKSAVFVRKPVR